MHMQNMYLSVHTCVMNRYLTLSGFYVLVHSSWFLNNSTASIKILMVQYISNSKLSSINRTTS